MSAIPRCVGPTSEGARYPFVMPVIEDDLSVKVLQVGVSGIDDPLLKITITAHVDGLLVEVSDPIGNVAVVADASMLLPSMRKELDADNQRLRDENAELLSMLSAQRLRADGAMSDLRKARGALIVQNAA